MSVPQSLRRGWLSVYEKTEKCLLGWIKISQSDQESLSFVVVDKNRDTTISAANPAEDENLIQNYYTVMTLKCDIRLLSMTETT